MHLTKEILVKRAESLFGKIPPPVFKTEIENTAYRVLYEIREKINVTWVIKEANDFLHDVDLPSNWSNMTRYEKAAYVTDNSDLCRKAFKRCWYKKIERSNPLHHHS